MINGVHTVISSIDPDADRAFLRDVLELPSGRLGAYQPGHARPEPVSA